MNIGYWLTHPSDLARRLSYLVFDKRNPDVPFLAPGAIRFLDQNLRKDHRGLEWGSGRSTCWLAERLGSMVSVEHDASWYQEVSAKAEARGLQNIDYRLIPLEHPEQEPTRPHYDPLPAYVALADDFEDESFDVIFVDGHYRQACAIAGQSKLRTGGLLLVDDTDWIPLDEWHVPTSWQIVHQSKKINTTTTIWRKH